MVMCMNQQINPTLLLDQQVIKAKIPLFNKALFKNGIEESSFIGREVMKVSFENDLYGRCYEGNAYAFCEKAKKYELLLVPGDDFGAPGFVRIAYCVTTAQIEQALPAFEKLAKEYFA